MASAAVKNQLCSWALSALQMTHENINTSPIVKCICKTIDNSLNSSGVENVAPAITRAEVSNHCSYDSCWIVINNKVYDVTRFLRMHPGGDDIILEHAGYDATSVFIDKGHSRDAYEMLAEYFIGDIATADWLPEKEVT